MGLERNTGSISCSGMYRESEENPQNYTYLSPDQYEEKYYAALDKRAEALAG